MTYLELLDKATKLLDNNKITIRDWERMTEPLHRQVIPDFLSEFYPEIFNTDYVADNQAEYFRAFSAMSKEFERAKSVLTDKDYMNFQLEVSTLLMKAVKYNLNKRFGKE